MPLQASMAYPSSINTIAPEYTPWDEDSMPVNTASSRIMPPQDEFTSRQLAEGMHAFLCCFLCYNSSKLAFLKGTFQHFLCIQRY